MNTITSINSLHDRMKEMFSIISDTIETPRNLKKKIEEEEMSFLKKLSDIVEDINKGLSLEIKFGKSDYSVEIINTLEDGEEVKNAHRLVNAIKDLYMPKGYNVNVSNRHNRENYSSCYDVTISF